MNASLSLAQQTYENAVEIFRSEYTKDESKKRWLDGKNTFQDVEAAIQEAKAKYDAKSQSDVSRYLRKFSSTVMFYSKIMDMLVQHHPEYVSLAWGTMKLLFVLVVNHEQLVTELAKSLARIADVLPRVDMHLHLYPTDTMKHAVEHLYALLILFYQRALRWYEDRPWRHAIKALFKPYPLHLEDLVEQIQYRTREIESLAIVMAHKDIREMWSLVKDCLTEQKAWRSEQRVLETGQAQAQSTLLDMEQSRVQITALLLDMKTLLHSHQTVNSGILLTTQRSTQELQVATMIAQTTSVLFVPPHDSLRRRRKICARLHTNNTHSFENVWQAGAMRMWTASREPSILLVNGTIALRSQTQAAATLMTELLDAGKATVLWALKSPDRCIPQSSICELLKYLALQALQIDPDAVGQTLSPGFNAARVASAHTEEQWLHILETFIARFPFVYLVIDAEMLGQSASDKQDMELFVRLLETHMLLRCQNVVKIVIVSYRREARVSRQESRRFQTLHLEKLMQPGLDHASPVRAHQGHLRQRGALSFKRRVVKI